MVQHNEVQYITVIEACRIARVSRQTLYGWRKANLFQWHSFSAKMVRIEKNSFLEFLKRQKPVFQQAQSLLNDSSQKMKE